MIVGEREILLAPGDNVIGRATAAAVRIDSTGVSRRHARISVGLGEAALEDLGSKNGTRIWDREVEGPTLLRDGDRIALGETPLIFRVLPSLARTRTQGSPSSGRQPWWSPRHSSNRRITDATCVPRASRSFGTRPEPS